MTELAFYFVLDCPRCNEPIHYGPCLTFLEYHGRPVVPADMVSQSRVDCFACNTEIYLGDLDYLYEDKHEPEAPPDEVAPR